MIMGGALLVAIVVAMLVNAKLSPKTKKEADVSNQVLVANRQILTGEVLKPEDVRWEPWPAGGMFQGVIKHEEYPDKDHEPDIYQKPLRRKLESGEPITFQAMVPDVKAGNNFLAATISPGMRAVGMPVSAVSAAGGFVAPGDHVDVILSYQTALPDQLQDVGRNMFGRYASQTVLSDVKVLAVDQNFKDEKREAKIARVVTLEVSKEDAETLALAAQLGDLSLALRRIGERDTAASMETPITSEARISEVFRKLGSGGNGGGGAIAGTVRVYNGTSVQNVPVRQTAN